MIKTRASLLGALIMAICLFGMTALGQDLTRGTLRGTVADAAGAIVPGASITVRNEATGVTQTVTSDNEGNYQVQSLLPGNYTITVEKQGYKKVVRTGQNIVAGNVTSVPVGMEAGSISETVTVTASGEETLATDTAQVSNTVGTRKVEDLPANGAGGGIDTLALLTAGVVPGRSGTTNTNGTELSVNGNRARSNNFQIDGADNNDLSIGGPALFVDFQDAVQEFQVITTNYSAQYGRNQGSIVNIVTKGGGNEFHGSAFVHHQDWAHLSTLDNKEKASGQKRPDQNLYTVFGGTIGGPMPMPHFGEGGRSWYPGKNRSFFYVSYQEIRNPTTTTTFNSSVSILANQFPFLTAAFPTNNVVAAIVQNSAFAIPGGEIRTRDLNGTATQALISNTCATRVVAVGTTGLNPACGYTALLNPATGQPFLFGGAYDIVDIPDATGAHHYFQAAQIQRNLNTTYNERDWSTRFDFRPSSRDSATFRIIHQNSVGRNGISNATGMQGDIPASSSNIGGNYTHNFSNNKLNDFRAYYQQIKVDFGGGCDTSKFYCYTPSSSVGNNYTNITFSRTANFNLTKNSTVGLTAVGGSTGFPQGRVEAVTQFIDNFTWIKGRHTITMGGEYKRLTTVSNFLPTVNGTYNYSSLTRLRNNAPNTFTAIVGNPTITFPEHDLYGYVQDDFKLRPNLTLNLGVRYEYSGQPVNVLNDLTTARENGSGRFYNPALPLSIRTVPRVAVDKNNWAPRVGFAYTPHFWKSLFGEDRTVIRGGFSIAYDPSFYNILLNVLQGAPYGASVSLNNAPGGGLESTTTSPVALPLNPTGTAVRSLINPYLGTLDPTYLSQTRVDPNFHSPYSMQWSLGIQHRFGAKQIVEARYVGNHAVGLFQSINDNFYSGPIINGFTDPFGIGIKYPSLASSLPAGTPVQSCTDNTATVGINEGICNNRIKKAGSITTRNNSGFSFYNGAQFQYSGRFMSDSLTVGASYTWSKTIDNASEIFSVQGTSANAQNPFCLTTCERALSSLDHRHAASMSFIYDLPFYKEQKGFVGHLLGGWQLNGIYVLTSGFHYTPQSGYSGFTGGLGTAYLTVGDRPWIGNPNAPKDSVGINAVDAYIFYNIPQPTTAQQGLLYSLNELNTTGNVKVVTLNDVKYVFNGPGAAGFTFHSPFGNAPRNSETGPIVNQLNMSLFKNTQLTERIRMQFRAEAFNVLNHPNPGFGVGAGGSLPDNSLLDVKVPNSGFANNSDIEYGRRVLQFGLRFTF
jgi:outer membrane receptor protein involved in Fe transport